MCFEGTEECGGRGEESFFEEFEDKLGGKSLGGVFGVFDALLCVLVEGAMDVAFFFGVVDFECLDVSRGESRLFASIDEFGWEFAFESPYHDGGELFAIGCDASVEALVIEEFEESGKAFGIAIVWCGGEEEFVFEVWGEHTDGLCAL